MEPLKASGREAEGLGQAARGSSAVKTESRPAPPRAAGAGRATGSRAWGVVAVVGAHAVFTGREGFGGDGGQHQLPVGARGDGIFALACGIGLGQKGEPLSWQWRERQEWIGNSHQMVSGFSITQELRG